MARRLATLVVVLALAHCSGPQLRDPPQDGPKTAAELLAKLSKPSVQTLQGTGRIDAYSDGDRKSATVLMVASRPKSLQFQALTPTLDMVALLSTDGQTFTSFERGGDRCLVGKACPRNLARLLPLPLPPEGLVAALLGDMPVLPAPADQQTLHWDADKALYRVDVGAPAALHQQLFVDPHGFRVAGAVWFFGETRLASLQYQGELAGNRLPQTLRIKVEKPAADITLQLRDVQADQPVAAEVFAVQCPDGMAKQTLPCEDD